MGLFTAAALHPLAIRQNPWLFGAVSAGTALLFIYLARNPLFLPLEGIDFTKDKTRPARRPGRWAPWSLFNFARRKSRDLAAGSERPERQADAILRKISESGMESLTKEERSLLEEVSDKYRRRAAREKPKSGFPF